MLTPLFLLSFIFYHVLSTVNLDELRYVPAETPCRQCSRSSRSHPDNPYQGLGLKKSPRFLFGDVPCCESTVKSLQNAPNCGVADPDITNRIVGGQDASENQLPWQCAIMRNDNTYTGCAATLVSCDPAILITVANCFKGPIALEYDPRAPLQVSCGGHRMENGGVPAPLDSNERKRFITSLDHIKIHPNYDEDTFENDIAVFKVDSFPCKEKEIWPACLPFNEKFKDLSNWETTVVSGWGLDGPFPRPSPGNLKWAKVEPISVTECNQLINPLAGMDQNPVKDSMVCAKPAEDSTGIDPQAGEVCNGDDGGPMVTKAQGDAGFSLVGVINQVSCGFANLPSAYTEVSQFVDWISEEALKLSSL